MSDTKGKDFLKIFLEANLIDTAQRIADRGKRVLPTKLARKYLKISQELMDKSLDKEKNQGLIKYQVSVAAENSSRPILAFEVPYLKEILGVIGTKRGPGKVLFTPEAVSRIELINKKWSKQFKEMR
jgi:hypothetical protein